MKYTYKQLNKDFPNDEKCLEYIFKAQYGENPACPSCGNKGLYKLKNRKCYSCSKCAKHIYPLSDTIFHKSATPLKDWFFAIYLMSSSKNGVSAKEIERHLGCTYKTAWRMAHKIRTLMKQGEDRLSGVLEADETYTGGYKKGDMAGHQKMAVLGVVERGGGVRTKYVDKVHTSSILEHIGKNVEFGSTLYSDEYSSYKKTKRMGLFHESIKHSKKEYARGDVHTNTIEGFWGQMKRSMDGTYHSVSKKHLQSYLDEFSWRYSQRFSEIPLFVMLLSSASGQKDLGGQKMFSYPLKVA